MSPISQQCSLYRAFDEEHGHCPHDRKVPYERLKNHPQDTVELEGEAKIDPLGPATPPKAQLFLAPPPSPEPETLRAKTP